MTLKRRCLCCSRRRSEFGAPATQAAALFMVTTSTTWWDSSSNSPMVPEFFPSHFAFYYFASVPHYLSVQKWIYTESAITSIDTCKMNIYCKLYCSAEMLKTRMKNELQVSLKILILLKYYDMQLQINFLP